MNDIAFVLRFSGVYAFTGILPDRIQKIVSLSVKTIPNTLFCRKILFNS